MRYSKNLSCGVVLKTLQNQRLAIEDFDMTWDIGPAELTSKDDQDYLKTYFGCEGISVNWVKIYWSTYIANKPQAKRSGGEQPVRFKSSISYIKNRGNIH